MRPRSRTLRLLTHLAVSLALATLWLHPMLRQRAPIALGIALLWPALALPVPVPWPRWHVAWNALLVLTISTAVPLWFSLPWLRLDLLVLVILMLELRWAHTPAGAARHRLMLAVSTVPVVLTSLTTESAWFAVLAVPYVLCTFGGLLWSELMGGLEGVTVLREESSPRLPRRLLWHMVPALSAVIALIGLGLFTLFPRGGTSHAQATALTPDFALTGMSDWVELGTFEALLSDPTPALRVASLNQLWAEPNYLRGGALPDLERFTDGSWRWTRERRVAVSVEATANAFTPLTAQTPEQTLVHRVELLDPSLRTLFAPQWLIGVEGQGGVLHQEPGDRWRFPNRDQTWPVYTTHSAPGQPPEMALEAEGRRTHLSLPPSMRREVRALLVDRRIVSLLAPPTERVQSIVQYLRANHRYSLEPPPPGTDNPILDFIGSQTSGNCEQFASAMTVMCRAADVPARLVTGFHGGEREPNGALLFRRSHAHAWVEIWVEGEGWLQRDPTPPVSRALTSDGLLAGVVDSAGGTWRELVVHYQGLWHRDLVRRAADTGERLMMGGTIESGALRRSIDKMALNLTQEPSLWVIITAIAMLNAMLLWAERRWRRGGAPWKRWPVSPEESLLWRLAQSLASRPRVRAIDETPAEYLSSLEEADQRPWLTPLIDRYYARRFGGRIADVTDRDLVALAKSLREQPSAPPQGA
jgi:transglutaminase-like putative cysteine protease